MKKKRHVTLIEIMIVILLIGLIGGAVAFNMRGSLDHGRKFKTEQNIARVQDILNMEYASGDKTHEQIEKEWVTIVTESPLANKKETTLDGWKKELKVEFKDGAFVASRSP